MRIILSILFNTILVTSSLLAWNHMIVNNSNVSVLVKINLVAAPRCKAARIQPHSSFSYSVGGMCLNTFQFNNQKVPIKDGCADQLLTINSATDYRADSSLKGFTDLQKEVGTKTMDIPGDNCQNHLIKIEKNNTVQIESSVGPFLDFMLEEDVVKLDVKGNNCINHRLFISKYNNNEVSLWSDINPLPNYMNDAITCNCGRYKITQTRDSILDAQNNLSACQQLCDPPKVVGITDITTHKEVVPGPINGYAYKDDAGKWHANLDVITCHCNNNVQFSKSGDGNDTKDNNRFCWLNCKKGWTDDNFTVDWGHAPAGAKNGDIIFQNSRRTRWTKDTVEYLSLATIGE